MQEATFQTEQNSLLSIMAAHSAPDGRWPDGCYGSRLAWLTFVGPSPGGGDGNASEVPRQELGEVPLWNQEYAEPCASWSVGFRVSTQILVEAVLERKRDRGALKLYNFANFNWMQNPNACNVPIERMRLGSGVVIKHLEEVKPRVIVTMEEKAHQILSELLGQQYTLRRQQFTAVEILIGNTRRGLRYHRTMDAYELNGAGSLAGKYVIRCPQHPARIFNADYAGRIARALRTALCGLANHAEMISVKEH